MLVKTKNWSGDLISSDRQPLEVLNSTGLRTERPTGRPPDDWAEPRFPWKIHGFGLPAEWSMFHITRACSRSFPRSWEGDRLPAQPGDETGDPRNPPVSLRDPSLPT